MAVRNIVKIDEEKCNGCGDCVTACAEGAIQIIDGKAKLVSEVYCDGLGACLGHCPMDAISIEQREAEEFDEAATEAYLKSKQAPNKAAPPVCACPGMAAQRFSSPTGQADPQDGDVSSQLRQWPVQMSLLNPQAPYFQDADLLLAADCVAFAMGDFHSRFLKDRAVAIGCPKLDDVKPYIDKLSEILQRNSIQSLTVVRMEVPCCGGMTRIATEAIKKINRDMAFDEVTIGLQGQVKGVKMIEVR
jgi:Pyruvate/2-oxoacid:ferredoxin oxidoreductase delta subunit